MSTNETTSSWENTQTRVYRVIVPLMIGLCLIAAAVNCTLLLLVRWIRRPLANTTILAFGLAAADAWASFVFATGLIVNTFVPVVLEVDYADFCLQLTFEAFRIGATFTSVIHLVMLAICHYLAIAFPVDHSRMVTPMGIKVFELFAFALPPTIVIGGVCSFIGATYSDLLHAAPGAVSYSYSDLCAEFIITAYAGLTIRLIYLSTLFLIPFSLIAVLYGKMLVTLRASRKSSKFQLRAMRRKSTIVVLETKSDMLEKTDFENLLEEDENTIATTMLVIGQLKTLGRIRRSHRTLRTTLLMMLSFVVGWLPTVFLAVLMCDGTASREAFMANPPVRFAVSLIANLLIIVKFFSNPLIYGLRIPAIRDAFWFAFCRRASKAKRMSTTRYSRTSVQS